MTTEFLYILFAGAAIAAAGGMIGSFALLRRMALVGDALSHVALPGIALGIIFNFNPFLGAFAFLAFGTLVIWAVEHRTKLPAETLVGIVFTLSLAVGALLSTEEELLEALFGDISKVSRFDVFIAVAVSVLIMALLLLFYKKFALTLMSPDLSLSVGYKPHLLELLFLTIFALGVAAGIKFTGVLLMGSIIIIPAATARNIAWSMRSYIWLSAFLGILGASAGIFAAKILELAPGPLFVIIAGILFFFSVLFRRG